MSITVISNRVLKSFFLKKDKILHCKKLKLKKYIPSGSIFQVSFILDTK